MGFIKYVQKRALEDNIDSNLINLDLGDVKDKSPLTNGLRLNDYCQQIQNNIASNKRVRSKSTSSTLNSNTYNSRMVDASNNISVLVSPHLYKGLGLTMYDGKAAELVESYERIIAYENEAGGLERLREAIDEKKANIPRIVKQEAKERREILANNVRKAKVTLDDIYSTIKDTIEIRQKNIRNEIDRTQSEYENAYKDILNTYGGSLSEVVKTIKQLKIPTDKVSMPRGFDAMSYDVDEIVELVNIDKELIQCLRDPKSLPTSIQEILEERQEQTKNSSLLNGKLYTPISLGQTIIGIGKQLRDIGATKRLLAELQNEILLCYKIIKTQLTELKKDYSPPDVSKLKSELEAVEESVKAEKEEALLQADREYKQREREQQSEEQVIEQDSISREQQLQEEVLEKERELEEKRTEFNDNLAFYKATWEEERLKYAEEQASLKLNYNLDDDRVLFLSEEISTKSLLKRNKRDTTMDKLRYFRSLETLEGLTYNTEPKDETPFEQNRSKYDRELLEEREKVRAKVQELINSGWTKEKLEAQVEEYKRELDKYYIPNFKGIFPGVHILPANVKAAIANNDEYYKCEFENKTLLFLYDEMSETEETVLTNYIKTITQSLMLQFHPDSIQVNIVNPTRSLLLSNLQVSLDTVDKDTGAIIKGRPYAEMYTSNSEISDLYKDQDISLDILIKRDLMRQDFMGLIKSRRLKDAKCPLFHINILHRVDCDTPFATFNEESGKVGIINIYIMSKESFLKEKRTGNDVEMTVENERFLRNVTHIVETKNINGEDVIYVSSPKKHSISRHIYKVVDNNELNQKADMIAKRALLLPPSSILTEEFVEHLTGGKYWQESAKKFVKLFFGYIEGDKSRAIPTILDENDSVHMFIGGTTGGGKSNLLAVMVNCLKMMYPPSQLDVIYFDFKVVEVALHANPYKMPHCTAMSGTDQPMYLISLLNYCDREMTRRYNLIKQYGAEKFSNLYDKMMKHVEELRADGRHEEADKVYKLIPRRLIILVDEAAQAFQLEDSNAVDVVKLTFKRIAQLARAAGMHMILVSQDPTKMPAEVLSLMRVRGCTKATPAVSQAIMYNNNICGRSCNQFIGFFATTNNVEGEESGNKSYVVPLNLPETTKKFTKIAYDMSVNDINRDAIVFDSDVPYSELRHNIYLKGNPDIINSSRVLLGEPVKFSTVFSPLKFDIECDSRQNIGIFSTDSEIKKNMFETFVRSTYNNSIYWPVYCKKVPNYAPIEFFVNKAKEQGYYGDDGWATFNMFFGEGSCDFEKLVEEHGIQVNQYYKQELMSKADYPEDCNIDFYSILKDYTQIRLLNKTLSVPVYLIIFDIDLHKTLLDMSLTWRTIGGALNSANMANIHAVIISSSGENAITNNITGHIIGSRLGDAMSYPKPLKNIPHNLCMYMNATNPLANCLFKPISFEKFITHKSS